MTHGDAIKGLCKIIVEYLETEKGTTPEGVAEFLEVYNKTLAAYPLIPSYMLAITQLNTILDSLLTNADKKAKQVVRDLQQSTTVKETIQ
jgi:hypothetical protein